MSGRESDGSARRPDGPVGREAESARRPAVRTFLPEELDQIDHGPVVPILEGPWPPDARNFRDPEKWASAWIEHPHGAAGKGFCPCLAGPQSDLVAVRHVGRSMLPLLESGDLVIADLDRPAVPGRCAVALYLERRTNEHVARVRLVVSRDTVHARCDLAVFNPELLDGGLLSVQVSLTALVVGRIPWWATTDRPPFDGVRTGRGLSPEEVAALAESGE